MYPCKYKEKEIYFLRDGELDGTLVFFFNESAILANERGTG